ncbi:MAG: hypothetical protein A2X94_17575 [Bdellovibrionales bacterium GWB1_55_8]|nr:MAG: hypothetical protein A2X94_17575 [Bdellovibrionales bacterium GWB1_55_8]
MKLFFQITKYLSLPALAVLAFTAVPNSKQDKNPLDAFGLIPFAHALNVESCATIMDRYNSCATDANTYTHGALRLFRASACFANFNFTALAEATFCHLSKSLAIDPGSLEFSETSPAEVSKTFGSKTVKVTFIKPTEAFAVAAGYTAKATVEIASATKSVIYWDGSEEGKTKGFMIEGPARFNDADPLELKEHGVYVQWDRTTEDQDVKYLAGIWQDSYLNDIVTDRAGYGHITYNTTTNAVDIQAINIQRQLEDGTAGTKKCYRIRGMGTFGGNLDFFASNPEGENQDDALLNENVDGKDMNGTSVVDLPSTPNGSPAIDTSAGTAFGGKNFDKHCKFVNTTTLFSTTTTKVNFAATPSDVF